MRQLGVIVGLLLSLTVIGTLGIHFTTNEPWLESAYLAIVTLTTVGSRDVPVGNNPVAMVFVMSYLVLGLGVFSYGAFELGQLIVNAEFHRIWERGRMEKRIENLNGHYIVCGQGRMGTAICEYLHERKRPFVVIDKDREVLDALCRDNGWLYVHGDSTDDDILRAAGIERAKSLATTLATDADNVYVVLTARLLSPQLQIVARASDDDAIVKMQRAGATRVISPFSSGASKMARLMLNPNIEDFLEVTGSSNGGLELVDVMIAPENRYVGKKLAETDLRENGIMIIGIRRSEGATLIPPPGSATIEAGDCLFVFGDSNSVTKMLGEAAR